MPADVTIIINEAERKAAAAMLRGGEAAVNRCGRRAVKRTVNAVRSNVVKQAARQSGLRQKEIRQHTRIVRTSDALWSAVRIDDRALPMIRLKPRKHPKGITYRTPRGGRKLRRHAFRATMPGGHKGIYKRRRVARLPIDEQSGPSVLKYLRRSLPRIELDAAARLHKEFDGQIARELEREARRQ